MQGKRSLKKVKNKRATSFTIGIVVAEYYKEITDGLLAGVFSVLRQGGVAKQNVVNVSVSGSFEIPYGCLHLLKNKKVDAIITLGCIIKGETEHDRYIASSVAQGITQLMLEYDVPISFGVITANTLEQAKARSKGTMNKGKEAATAVLQSLTLK